MEYNNLEVATVEWKPDNEFIIITSPPVAEKPAAPAPLGSRSNPIPQQTAFLTPQGIEITVKYEVEEDSAWNIIRDANMFNEPPDNNMKYVIVTYTVKNVSSPEETVQIDSYDFALTGSSNRLFNGFDRTVVLPSSGPHHRFDETLYHGGSATGSSVFHVPASETHLLLVWNYLSSDGKVYFEVPWYMK